MIIFIAKTHTDISKNKRYDFNAIVVIKFLKDFKGNLFVNLYLLIYKNLSFGFRRENVIKLLEPPSFRP